MQWKYGEICPKKSDPMRALGFPTTLPAWLLLALLVYNLILLCSFTFTGYFTYRLALSQTQHRGGALLAGVIFAFINFRIANTVRLNVLATEWQKHTPIVESNR